MPATSDNLSTPVAPSAPRHSWLRWILIWLFGAVVGAAIAIWWLLPQVGKVSFTDVIGRHHVATANQPTTNPSSTPATPTTVPADASAPAASSCLGTTASNVVVTLNQDVPSPRCVQVTSSQTFSFNNQMGVDVTLTDGAAQVAIPSGQTGHFDFTKYSFGSGVHDIKVAHAGQLLYGGSGPEVWVQ